MAAELILTAAGLADAGAFLARLVRLNPGAVVRVIGADPGRVVLWAMLPWDVLVTRTVAGSFPDPGDAVTRAADLLSALAGASGPAGDHPVPVRLPQRRDSLWRWPLPPDQAEPLESLPAETVRELGRAAERTMRAVLAGGGPVGERARRDALLDHPAIVVSGTVSKPTAAPIEVPQRLVQAVVRMGFLRSTGDSPEPPVHVLAVGPFVGLAAEYGVTWYRKSLRLPLWSIVRTAEPR